LNFELVIYKDPKLPPLNTLTSVPNQYMLGESISKEAYFKILEDLSVIFFKENTLVP